MALTSPAILPGLGLWLDASQIGGSDNDPVSTWPDMSPNGYDATQSNPTNKPTLKTGVVNGLDVVRFTTTPDQTFMEFTGAALGLLRNRAGVTIASVTRSTDAGGGSFGWFYMRDGSDFSYRAALGNDQLSFEAYFHPVDGDASYAAGGYSGVFRAGAVLPGAVFGFITGCAVLSLENRLISVVNTANLGAPTNFDNAEDFSGPSAFPDTDSTSGAVGDDGNGGGVNGDFAELVVYTRAIDFRERRLLMEYLSTKWGTL